MRNNKQWTADELVGACTTAKKYGYKDEIYPLIGLELDRSSLSVQGAISRVRNGQSCFQYNINKLDKRLLTFLNENAKVIKYQSKSQTSISFPKEEKAKPAPPAKLSKRGFSFSIGWGLIKISR